MAGIRHISIPNLHNLRDLGGYEASGGRVTLWNRLYRCDCPSELAEDGWQKFRDLNIKTLVDLRSTYEASESPVKAPGDFEYTDCHFFYEEEGADLTGEAGKKFLQSLSMDYRVMTENSSDRVALILKTILESLSKGNTVFFCTAGKDRTGIIAALILKLCGASDEDIIADYCITEVYNAAVIQAKLDSIPKEIMEQVSPETLSRATYSKPEVMKEYLEWLSGYDLFKIMDEKGFTYEMQEDLKNILITER
ncbi:MAG: tyrosine-protein phosphatase [Lachnospiraceae bacterium]|nr:tyrosine-protein phosphatase [Lachnospiraceae bacterium]